MRCSNLSTVIRRVSQLPDVGRTGHQSSLAMRLSFSICALRTESYSPSSITAALNHPSSLRGVQHIIIQEPCYYVDSKQELYKPPDPWNPARVLSALEAMPDVKSISIDINQIMFHSATSDEILRYHFEKRRPGYVLGQLGLSCQCTDICAWSVEEYPKVLIHHSTIRKLLLESRQHKNDHQIWKYVVSQQVEKPEHKAFDYTAEFHIRDVCDPDCDCASTGPTVDLGLWAAGKYRCGSMSELSMHFVQDFMWNTQFFLRNPRAWRPDLYIYLRGRDSSVSSVLASGNCSD